MMRLRLFLSFVLIALVSVISVVLVARQNTTTAVRAFMFRGGMTGEGGLVQTLEAYYQANHSWQGVDTLLQAPGSGHGRGMMQGAGGGMSQRLRLADAQGRVIADTAEADPAGSFSSADKENAVQLQVGGQVVGYLLAEGGMGFTQRDESFLVNRITSAALTAGLIAGGLSLLLAVLLAYSLMRPVRELTGAARELGKGDLSQRVKIKGSDELAVLAGAFNSMADSLQKVNESRRSMTADIAHELRNPLAVQRANLEALQDGVYPLDPGALEPILEQNLLLTRLVDDLRTLALADAGQLKLERAEVDIAGLIEQIVERNRSQAALHRISLQFQVCPGTSVPLMGLVDPMRVDQIVGNLLSNAFRHTPEGGRVAVEVCNGRGQAVVTVHDSGSGIPEEALPRLFERFFRADRSRSRSEGGTGLGLAIARQLAEAHGGTLLAGNHPAGGALFTLRLPLKPGS